MHKSVSDFVKLHNFKEELAGYVGIELEFFILEYGKIQPSAPTILKQINQELSKWNSKTKKYLSFSCELSACQIEYQVGPIQPDDLMDALIEIERFLEYLEWRLNFHRLYCGAANFIPLDVYPNERYEKITKSMPENVLAAACQVAGLHVHIGMPDHETALKTYIKSICQTDYLIGIGDESGGKRHKLYSLVANDPIPKPIDSWSDQYAIAMQNNFVDNPSNNYSYIRMTKHGTVEFRMFDSTGDIERIVGIVKLCCRICLE